LRTLLEDPACCRAGVVCMQLLTVSQRRPRALEVSTDYLNRAMSRSNNLSTLPIEVQSSVSLASISMVKSVRSPSVSYDISSPFVDCYRSVMSSCFLLHNCNRHHSHIRDQRWQLSTEILILSRCTSTASQARNALCPNSSALSPRSAV
jgi:hypothetical protein